MESFFPRRHRASLIVDLLIGVFCVAIIALSAELDSRAKIFPVIVGWFTLFLIAIDIVAQSNTLIGRAVFTFFAGSAETEDREGEARREARSILFAIGWICVFVVGVWIFGFLPVIPVFMFVSMRVFGDNTTIRSLITTAVIMLIIWAFFEYALDYTLYRGLIWELLGFE
ncbi:MAG: tripartite tricarboxylate transporter TctB family protein [Beijerinckiaceae bacterium]|jgi:hypothetical protein|nr:tripartite tricarboxylate transporter TctB family protein [Beijerinckiaceae bacterium]